MDDIHFKLYCEFTRFFSYFFIFFHHLRRLLPLSFSYNNILICSGSSTSRASYSYSSCRLLLHLVVVVSFLIWLVHTALRQRRILIRLRLSSRVESNRNTHSHTHTYENTEIMRMLTVTEITQVARAQHTQSHNRRVQLISVGLVRATLSLQHYRKCERFSFLLFGSGFGFGFGFGAIWFFQYCDAKSATVCHANTCHRRSNNQAIIIYQMSWLILNSRIRSNDDTKCLYEKPKKNKNYA